MGRSVIPLAPGRWVRAAVMIIVMAMVIVVAVAAPWQAPDSRPATGPYALAAAETSDAINPIEINVLDGDTIRARGRTIRLIGFDAPEAGARAQCRRERELAGRAAAQLKVLIAGGGLELRLVPCSCPPGLEGTPECNGGHACGQLRSYGRDIGALMIQYVLARPHVCGPTSCPPRTSWC